MQRRPGRSRSVIWVSLQHPSPYYDDSYGVNSANNGPYGDAIMQELIPAVETQFRIIREPWARMLTGGSTGGWIALAHQVFYPDFYGGSFALCPDGVDFRYHQIVNVYDDANAYWVDQRLDEARAARHAAARRQRHRDDERRELVRARAGRPLALGRPVGHLGSDLRPGRRRRLSEAHLGQEDRRDRQGRRRRTGRQHYDLRNILETNWATLGPKVANKINVYVGDADTYYLNMGVHMLDDFLTKADNPKWTGEIVFQPMAPHCWGPRGQELMDKIVAQIEKYAPAGADLKSWKY